MGTLTTTAIFAAADAVAGGLLMRIVPRWRFRGLARPTVVAAAIFWAAFATWLGWRFWDAYYGHFAPEWQRWLFPVAGALYAAIAAGIAWLAARAPFHPVLAFALLGGLEGVLEHLIAIYRFGILEKVPLLAGEQPLPILVLAFFEYAAYWFAVVAIALALRWSWTAWHRGTPPPV